MNWGGLAEMGCLLVVPRAIKKFGLRKVMIFGLIALVVRYLSFYIGGVINQNWMFYIGILIHGLIFGFFYLGGQIYIDKKAPANGCAGMDIDSCFLMRFFAHYSRNEGNLLQIQLMRYPVGGDGQKAWIAQNDFVKRMCRRVAVKCRPYIALEQSPDFGQLLKQIFGYLAGHLAASAGIAVIYPATVLISTLYLLGQLGIHLA